MTSAARWVAWLAAAVVWGSTPAWAQAPAVAAAADLTFALEEIAARFRTDTGREVRLVFGSSGNLFRQIHQGAPFELFLSADEAFVLRLADAGLTVDRGALYAVGRLALWVPHGSPLKADGSLRDLAAALEDGRLRTLAIANPEHAPYGRRAEEALRRAGVWERVRARLVLGENVSQAARFAMSGDAQGALIAYSLALAPPVARWGTFGLVPEGWHAPLRQRMALLHGAGAAAREFFRYLQGDAAREVMRRYGFVLPGEAGWTGRR
jgi:molybdate transport system substrate-binding protein